MIDIPETSSTLTSPEFGSSALKPPNSGADGTTLDRVLEQLDVGVTAGRRYVVHLGEIWATTLTDVDETLQHIAASFEEIQPVASDRRLGSAKLDTAGFADRSASSKRLLL